MRLLDELSLSVRSFRSRPKRSFLTIFGVSVGIGAVLFLVSLGNGLQTLIIGQITTADALLSLDVSTTPSAAVQLNQTAINRIAKLPHVVEEVRLKNLNGRITTPQDVTTQVVLRAIDDGYFRLAGISAVEGHLFTLNDHGHDHLVLSSAAAALLGYTPQSIIDQHFTIDIDEETTDDAGLTTIQAHPGDHPFHVLGVIEDDSLSYGFIRVAAAEDIVSIPAFDNLKIKVDAEENAPITRDEIINQGFVVSALSDIIKQAKQVFRVVQIALGSFGLIALFVSAIGMFNTMTIALLERTNEIGIMRSVGVTPGDIGRLFVVESMLMGFLGGLGGLGVGWIAGELVNIGFNVLAGRLGGTPVDLFVYPLWFMGVIIGFSTLIGFITGFFPARRAAKMDPLEALRYK